jgi:hypothetical protein
MIILIIKLQNLQANINVKSQTVESKQQLIKKPYKLTIVKLNPNYEERLTG